MIRKYETEFYIGIVVWLLSIPTAYAYWASELGTEAILVPLSAMNLVAVALLFCLYLVGYLHAHGGLGRKPRGNRRPLGIAISSAALIILSVHFLFYSMVGCMTMMVVTQLPSIFKQRRGIATAVAVAIPVVFEGIDVWLGKGAGYGMIIIFMVTFFFSVANVLALTVSYQALAEQDAKLESQNLVRELKATQLLLSAISKRDERLRIARNLHDILGHQLTALSLQLEVASHVDGDMNKEHIENAKTIGTALLTNVRETVSEFRKEKDFNLQEALSALVQGTPNLEVSLNVDWDESCASERQVEVLFRSAQEALTNVARHSEATRCDIKVSNDEQNLTLVVRDNGGESVDIQPGNGLKGMAERVNRIDGNLHFENYSDGFVLFVNLPISDT